MIKDADHVVVLDEGRVAEEGTPAELIAHGGWFADLANAGEDESYEAEEQDTEEQDMADGERGVKVSKYS